MKRGIDVLVIPYDVQLLMDVNTELKLYNNKIDFALDLFNQSPWERKEWLKDLVVRNNASPELLTKLKGWELI